MQSAPYIKTSNYEGRKGEVKKVVLLYSGGLDTSVMLKWIQDEYKAKVIALTIDIGQQADDLEAIKQKAVKLGAIKAIVVDAKDEFANEYISRGIKANASYQGPYHLSTPLGRPLLAKIAVEVAQAEGADCIAHGCTGKGNDQVRIEGTIMTLNPELKIIAPVREWSMGRDEELEYAKKNNIEGFVVISFSYNSEGSLVINDYNTSNTELSTYVISEMQKLQVCPWGKNPNNEYLVKINFTLL